MIKLFKIKPLRQLLCLLLFAPTLVANTLAGSEDWRWQNVARVVVIPDVHGAYPALVRLLKATGVVDRKLGWSGGKTHLVSLGDLLDRGAGSRAAMDLLMRLQEEALQAGGRVHVVMGNHEHMNLVGDLRYVAKGEYQAFAAEEDAGQRATARERFADSHPELQDTALEQAFNERYPPGYFAHRAAFRPDGRYGRWLLGLPTLVIVNDDAFVHGGLSELTSEMSAKQLNNSFSDDLSRYLAVWQELVAAGALPDEEPDLAVATGPEGMMAVPSSCIEARAQSCVPGENEKVESLLEQFNQLSKAPVHSGDSPFWYRGSIYCRDILERPRLNRHLENLGVNRLIVGHTPTQDGRVHIIRDGKVVMADTGMLVSYYKGRPAALVLQNGQTQVQYLDPEERLPADLEGRRVAYQLTAPQILQALAEGSIESVKASEDQQTRIVELDFKGKSIRAVFYPADRKQGAAKQLAADALDGLLGSELIPPTVARNIEGTDGALQLLYADLISEPQRLERGLAFSGWCPMQQQIQLMSVFDLLSGNRARTVDMIHYRWMSWILQLPDHQNAFGKSKRLPAGLKSGVLQVPETVISALESLTESRLATELGQWLSKKQRAALLARRDALLKFLAGGK